MVRVVNVPVAELALAAVPSAVRFGRVFVWQTLQRLQLDPLVEDAERSPQN
jgi:hypothetical protein